MPCSPTYQGGGPAPKLPFAEPTTCPPILAAWQSCCKVTLQLGPCAELLEPSSTASLPHPRRTEGWDPSRDPELSGPVAARRVQSLALLRGWGGCVCESREQQWWGWLLAPWLPYLGKLTSQQCPPPGAGIPGGRSLGQGPRRTQGQEGQPSVPGGGETRGKAKAWGIPVPALQQWGDLSSIPLAAVGAAAGGPGAEQGARQG